MGTDIAARTPGIPKLPSRFSHFSTTKISKRAAMPSLRWDTCLFREPSRPQDMQHHVLLRQRDARLFEALVRDLRLRFFEGAAGARMASLRQGPSPRLAAALLVLAALIVTH